MLINLGDVADGVLVSAIGAMGRMLTRPLLSRRVRDQMDIADWFGTGALTRDGLPGAMLELTGLSEGEGEELRVALASIEVQGALQALLAARLTDAPEIEAAKAREAVRAAVAGPPGTVAARRAEQVSGYYDDKICALAGNLQGRVGAAGLSQVRSEAYSSRIVALLGTLTDLVGALADPGRGGQAEAEFIDRYRRQARYRHGHLEPPDFDRRRKVPIDTIYVNTSVHESPHQQIDPDAAASGLKVRDLAKRLDRTVLLGDPGGGKTTAANVLAHIFASDAAGRIPFLVTLRDYAAEEPPERSVAGHIEYTLETLYQCPAPGRLVERLLLTGRAVVIFDGLDELLDTSRRRDVSERVEQFCSAYPLTPVLVTSRLTGYDQARLDDSQFTCYRLGGFGDTEVAEYAGTWFAVQEGAAPVTARAEAAAFLTESAAAPDLRSNPLLLSLMCILYRGAGSLPRDRAGIYAKCAELLFGTWDERRRIHRELRMDYLVEAALRHLAWWMLTATSGWAVASAGEIEAETASFLLRRGFETEDEARAAAREFVGFCHGRMWVLTDVGTTAAGERLYAFAHWTFLEYFAAAHLAAVSDSPGELARTLAPSLREHRWDVVGELAIAVKDRTSDRGADRVYAALLDPALRGEPDSGEFRFLAGCLDSVRPSPATVRMLTRAILDDTFRWPGVRYDIRYSDHPHPLSALLAHGTGYEAAIAQEISERVSSMVASDDADERLDGLWVALEACDTADSAFWRTWVRRLAGRYAAEITSLAWRSEYLRAAALYTGAISLEQALSMMGGLSLLMRPVRRRLIVEDGLPYPLGLIRARRFGELAAVGRYLASHPALPWVGVPYRTKLPCFGFGPQAPVLDELSGLGVAAVIAVCCELSGGTRLPVAHLPMPAQFGRVLRDWAEGRVNLVAVGLWGDG